MKKIIGLIIILFLIFSFGLNAAEFSFPSELKKLDYKVITQYPHDPNAFTQGLEIYEGELYEGTGLYGSSTLRRVDLKSGEIEKLIRLPEKYFGEGITIIDNKIYQLSWKENTAFVYDLRFNLLKEFNYQGEGWGLANDGQNLIMSNGSEYLYFRDRYTFAINREIRVHFKNKIVKNINELEYVDGFIYANIWQTDYIIKIKADNGEIISYLDLKDILDKEDYGDAIDVLNGIAYDQKNDHLLVTGKLWPKIFRIKINK